MLLAKPERASVSLNLWRSCSIGCVAACLLARPPPAAAAAPPAAAAAAGGGGGGGGVGFGSLECEQREVMPALIPGRRVSVSICASLRPHTLVA